jgi:Ca2+-dependent lipid-binding protein
MSLRLEDLLEAKKVAGRDWWPLSGCKSGKMRLSVEWKPLNMPGSLAGANQYRQPIGVVRLWIQKATDVKFVTLFFCLASIPGTDAFACRNVEATLGGKVWRLGLALNPVGY